MFRHRIDRHLVGVTAPTSMEAEQYQALRVKLERLQRERDLKVVAITSPGARDGKSVTAINLAASLARGSSTRVLLIEADMRRPAMPRYLAIDDNPAGCLSQLLTDTQSTLDESIQRSDALPFDLLLAGAATTPVHELLRSKRLERLIAEVRDRYDFVVLDTPPLGPVSDCALLARWVDGVLIVVSAHTTPRKQLEAALNQLEASSVLGIVFNRDDRPTFGYRHAYYRGYFPQARKNT
jgi:polysaccharide biosynthesis transport protein